MTWLSVITDWSTATTQQQQQQQQPLLPLPQVYVAENEGSRLPVTPEWLMAEVHAVPAVGAAAAAASCQPGSNGSSAGGWGSMHPVAAASLLALGLEQQQQQRRQEQQQQYACSSYLSCIDPGVKLEALLRLMYCFDVGELLPAAAARGGQQQQQQLEPAWQDAAARWVSAVLSEQYSREVVCGGAAAAALEGGVGAQQQPHPQQQQHQELYPCQVRTLLQDHAQGTQQQQQQQQLGHALLFPSWSVSPASVQLVDRMVCELAETSFGDPLFATHVALLLLPAAGSRLQRACWGALTDHGALHLLPPPRRCIGGSRAYLGVDVGPGVVGGADSGGGWGFGGFDVQLVGDMAKGLARGELKKAVQMQSLAGYMALHGIAGLCLDQGAWRDRAVADGPAAAAAAAVVDQEGAVGVSGHSSSSSSRIGTSPEGKKAAARPASEAAMAVNVLRGVLRGAPVDVLELLLHAGEARGLQQQEQGRALVQAAHGDAALMDKVRQLLRH